MSGHSGVSESENSLAIPRPDGRDYVQAGVRSLLGTIPYVGAAAGELLNLVVVPSLERRRKAWMQKISERIEQLTDRIESIENLTDHERFVTVFLKAYREALLTSNQEKLRYLQNSVINTALGFQIEELEESIIFDCIAKYSAIHIRTLAFFDNPRDWFRAHNEPAPSHGSGAVRTVWESAIHEIRGQRELQSTIWGQLISDGMISEVSLDVMMSTSVLNSRTTILGSKFVKLIAEV